MSTHTHAPVYDASGFPGHSASGLLNYDTSGLPDLVMPLAGDCSQQESKSCERNPKYASLRLCISANMEIGRASCRERV